MMRLEDILVTRNWVGKPVRKREDVRFVKGEATYVDDLDMDCHHVAILRSPYAHARITKIDTSRAEALEGVITVLTGQEIAEQTRPVAPRAITRPARQFVMAVDKVRYAGEPVAAVVAEDAYIAECQHFGAVIRGDELPRITARDGANTLRATLAVLEAAETGQRIVLQ